MKQSKKRNNQSTKPQTSINDFFGRLSQSKGTIRTAIVNKNDDDDEEEEDGMENMTLSSLGNTKKRRRLLSQQANSIEKKRLPQSKEKQLPDVVAAVTTTNPIIKQKKTNKTTKMKTQSKIPKIQQTEVNQFLSTNFQKRWRKEEEEEEETNNISDKNKTNIVIESPDDDTSIEERKEFYKNRKKKSSTKDNDDIEEYPPSPSAAHSDTKQDELTTTTTTAKSLQSKIKTIKKRRHGSRNNNTSLLSFICDRHVQSQPYFQRKRLLLQQKPVNIGVAEIIRHYGYSMSKFGVCSTVSLHNTGPITSSLPLSAVVAAQQQRLGPDPLFYNNNNNNNSSTTTGGHVTAMSFDSKGVLLAVGCSRGWVSLYDFDEVMAGDVSVRNERMVRNDLNGEEEGERRRRKKMMGPILRFGTGKSISCMEWNPSNEDQLAIGFLTQNTVKIYNVGTSPPTITNLKPSSSSSSSSSRRLPNDTHGIKSLLFVIAPPPPPSSSSSRNNNKNHRRKKQTRLYTGSASGMLHLWSLTSQNPKLMWSVSLWDNKNEGVSSIVHLGNNYRPSSNNDDAYTGMILLGGDRGTILLLDSERCTKKSFSTSMTPTVMKRWNLPLAIRRLIEGGGAATDNNDGEYNGIHSQNPPPLHRMGVSRMGVWRREDLPRRQQRQKKKDQQQKHDVRGMTPIMRESNDIRDRRIMMARHCLFETLLSIVTHGGWVFHVQLSLHDDDHNRNTNIIFEALHKTNRIVNRTTEGNGYLTDHYALSDGPCAGDMIKGSFYACIGYVPRVTRLMPHLDAKVVGGAVGPIVGESSGGGGVMRTVEREGLVLLDVRSKGRMMDVVVKVDLPSAPRVIVVHPNDEWVVVGYGDRGDLELVCMRDRHEQLE